MDNSGKESVSKIKSLFSKFVKFVLPLLIGILIIYLFMRDINPNELWAILKKANWAILAFSLIFGLLGNTIRGYRWTLFINALGYHPKISNVNFSVYGSYAVNFVLPRAGEVWRCGIIAKEEKIPFSKLFGTMILDRVFDTFSVLIITIIAFCLNMKFLLDQNQELLASIADTLTSPYLYLSIPAIIILIYVIFKVFKNTIVIKKIKSFLVGLGQDLKAIGKMKTKKRLVLYTIGIWTSYFLYFYITFYAFDFTKNLGFTAGLVAFALSSISMGVPSNGGLGPWQAAVIASLTLYGVDSLSATAYATGVFTIQSLWVVICGLFGIAALSIKNRHNK